MSLRSIALALLIASTALAVITPTAAADDPVPPVCTSSASPTVLSPGAGVNGQDPSLAASDDCWFKVDIPAGSEGKNLRITVNGTNNHDLQVSRGGPATAAQYVCSSIAL
ncbi:MAG: hypothetical protein QOC71_1207, partial [Thermoplasmata archaeon]|nr:hypothetical protein [Thermoplasmata archaeon]